MNELEMAALFAVLLFSCGFIVGYLVRMMKEKDREEKSIQHSMDDLTAPLDELIGRNNARRDKET